jgi:hypothetical protein
MLSKTIAIFINSNDSIEHIKLLYDFFHKDYDDFVIVTDNNDKIDTSYAVIPSIYLKFFQGSIVFLSAQSYLEKNNILSDNIYITTSIEEILNNNIPKSRLSGVNIITIQNNNKIEVIKYEKLQ